MNYKYLLLFLVGMFLISSASAIKWTDTYIYDDFADSSIDATKWDYTTAFNSSDFSYNVTEFNGYQRAYVDRCTGGTGSSSSQTMTIKFLQPAFYIGNIKFKTNSSVVQPSGTGYTQLILFGTTVTQQNGAGSISDNWTISWNESSNNHIYYKNGVYQNALAGTNTNLTFLGYANSAVYCQRVISQIYVFPINYSYGQGTLNATLNYPNNNQILLSNYTNNFNVSETTYINNLYNVTLYINGIENETKLVSGTANQTLFSKSFATTGAYNWTVFLCDNDTNCKFLPYTNYFNVSNWIENSRTYNSTIYETDTQNFLLNITAEGVTSATATLNFNGTDYSTTSSQSGNDWLFTNTLTVPASPGTKTFFWKLNLDGTQYNTTTNTTTLTAANFTICGGAPYNVPFINFTFKNETLSQQSVSASIASAFTYWLGDGTVTKSYTFSNLTGTNPSYGFCFNPPSRTLNMDATSFLYYNAESPQREYSATLTLTNTTTNKTLYLLPTSLGIYVTFAVINPAQQSLSDALITITSGTFGSVESKLTDSSGGATFFLNPLTPYTITITKSGYADSVQIITPTQSQYTITMGAAEVPSIDLMKGITFTTSPKGDELFNGTTYQFNFTIASSYWNLDLFGFTLTNGSDTLGSTSSVNPTGGTVFVNMNTGQNKSIHMNYYWVVNGTVFNASSGSWRIWGVTNTQYIPWSIATIFSDMQLFLSDGQGIFGLSTSTVFGMGFLIYIVIFFTAGYVSYRFGLTSAGAIMLMIFAAVALFNVGLDLIPIPNGTSQMLPTIATGIILLGVMFWEWAR